MLDQFQSSPAAEALKQLFLLMQLPSSVRNSILFQPSISEGQMPSNKFSTVYNKLQQDSPKGENTDPAVSKLQDIIYALLQKKNTNTPQSEGPGYDPEIQARVLNEILKQYKTAGKVGLIPRVEQYFK